MMIFFLIFAAIIVLVLQKSSSGKNLDSVSGDHLADKQVVEPGEQIRLQVILRNKSRRFLPFLRVRECFEKVFCLQNSEHAVSVDHLGTQYIEFTTWLRPLQKLNFSIPFSIHKRGRYVLKPLTLSTGDFLGTKEYSVTCGRFNEIVVVPREIPACKLGELWGGFMGDVSVNRFIMDDPVLTLGYREYTGREPMKMISWAQSARGAGLMVKKNDYTLEPSVSVILNVDTSVPNKEALLETCFSLTRAVCSQLESRGVKYAFSTNASLAGKPNSPCIITEGLGHRHFYGVLEQLGRATAVSRISLDRLLEKESLRQTTSGRILITPADETVPSSILNRLREVSGGNLLILRASEVEE